MRERDAVGAAASAARRAARLLAAAALACALLFLLAWPTAHAQTHAHIDALVIRPASQPSYDAIFDTIVTGIEGAGAPLAVTNIRLERATSPTALAARVAGGDPDVVITLGREANDLYRASKSSIPQIVGGLDLEPGTASGANGVALTPDPVFLLGRLKALMPEKKRVIVVFDGARDAWLVARANEVAKSLGLKIVAHEASTLGAASNHYWNVLQYGNPDTDVLWLLSNPNLVGDSNLPRLIEESWRRNFAVISNSIDHARRGVLLATYPDLEELGRQLAQRAAAAATDPKAPSGVEPLGAVKFAINKRIAGHLGLSLTPEDERAFDLILGER